MDVAPHLSFWILEHPRVHELSREYPFSYTEESHLRYLSLSCNHITDLVTLAASHISLECSLTWAIFWVICADAFYKLCPCWNFFYVKIDLHMLISYILSHPYAVLNKINLLQDALCLKVLCFWASINKNWKFYLGIYFDAFASFHLVWQQLALSDQ